MLNFLSAYPSYRICLMFTELWSVDVPTLRHLTSTSVGSLKYRTNYFRIYSKLKDDHELLSDECNYITFVGAGCLYPIRILKLGLANILYHISLLQRPPLSGGGIFRVGTVFNCVADII